VAPDLLPPGSRCKFCPATIHWTPTRLGRKLPLDPEPTLDGAWVVHQDPALGPTAYHYSPQAHAGATRYRSHLERCHPNDGKGPTPPRRQPDPTAGLKFPRRGEEVRP